MVFEQFLKYQKTVPQLHFKLSMEQERSRGLIEENNRLDAINRNQERRIATHERTIHDISGRVMDYRHRNQLLNNINNQLRNDNQQLRNAARDHELREQQMQTILNDRLDQMNTLVERINELQVQVDEIDPLRKEISDLQDFLTHEGNARIAAEGKNSHDPK